MSASARLVSPQGRLRAGWRAALFLLLLIVFASLGGVLAKAGATTFTRDDGAMQQSIFQTLLWIGVVLGALAAHWVMIHFVDRGSWSYVGLARRDAAARRVLPGLALGTLAVGIPCAALLVVGWLRIDPAPPAGQSLAAQSAALALFLLPAAFAEELLMRGYLLSSLADGMGRWSALVLTSVAFALLHAGNPGMSPGALVVVGLAGIFLGAVRFATSSLYAAWAAHFAWNAVLALVLHALVSGAALPGSGWRTVDAGPDWATGGPWGPEGGVPAALGLAAATALLIRRRRSAGSDTVTTATHE